MKPDCIEDSFLELHEGRLDEKAEQECRLHLEGCASCKEAFSDFQRVANLEAQIAAESPLLEEDLSSKVMKEVREYDSASIGRFTMAQRLDNWLTALSRVFLPATCGVLGVLVVCVVSLRLLGTTISGKFSGVASQLEGGGENAWYPPRVNESERVHKETYSDLVTRFNADESSDARSRNYQQPSRPSYVEPPVQAKRPNTERYGHYTENIPTLVSRDAISTFGLDVDTASYTNMRRFIENGQRPPADSVRIEEFLNYFDYDDVPKTDGPFGISYEIAPSPLEPERTLLKLTLQAAGAVQSEELGWNLVFLVDVSGSMASDDKLPLVQRSLKILVDNMRPTDRVAIVTYAGMANVALESTSGKHKERIIHAIDSLSSGGSTNGSDGIDRAYAVAHNNFQPGGVNRVILATDGDFNVGRYSFSELMELIERKREGGVSLTTLGFGTGNLMEENLEQLANRGNGNYFYIDSFREARRIFDRKLFSTVETVAKDVKAQIEFNPAHVREYRLIGYENRVMDYQDFKDDRVDSGDVGAGHTVTVLYELVLTNSELAKEQQEKFRYEAERREPVQEVESSNAAELAFLKIRYKDPNGKSSREKAFPLLAASMKRDLKDTSNDFRFAAAVSYFGHILRGSKYRCPCSLNDLAALARAALGEDRFAYRREFVELVEEAGTIRGRGD